MEIVIARPGDRYTGNFPVSSISPKSVPAARNFEGFLGVPVDAAAWRAIPAMADST
jgi:hypothetical protein